MANEKSNRFHVGNLGKILLYNAFHIVARLTAVAFYRIRVTGRENWPEEGGALVCSNHQSFFDPVLVGLCCERRLNYLARANLFKFPLKPFIQALNAIPVNRDGTGLDGLKETMKRLRKGEMVLIFPEGTRTRTGQLQDLKPGFVAVARKCKVPIVPIVFDGVYQAWPRDQKLPWFGTVHVQVGAPICPEQIASLSDDELVARLQSKMQNMFHDVHDARRQSVRNN